MKYLSIVLFTLIAGSAAAQVTFTVDHFSKDYFGRVLISDTSEVFSKGRVSIFDRKTKKQLISVNADELTFSLHEGKALANIQELPYGEQSQIMYEDYNFDGKNDFAIMDGQNSCYHGPSYKIYLATPAGFTFSPDFTRLAQDYCGMFETNAKEKKLSTMTKSGCCMHQFSEFIVQGNKPKAIRITEEDAMDFPFSTYSEWVWNGKKMVSTSTRTINLDEEGIKIVLRFHIDKSGKDIVLFNINDRTLNYVVLRKDSSVEFSYPIETVYQNPDFTLSPDRNTIAFKNRNANYVIYNDANKVGINITTDGKTYNWAGNNQTKKGTLTDLPATKLDNVVME